MVFVNSMSDLFHEGVDDAYIEAVCRVMVRADWHTYQVLTKRSERLRDMLNGPLAFAAAAPHIWWGVSVENRKHGVPRIEHLRAAPAGIHAAKAARRSVAMHRRVLRSGTNGSRHGTCPCTTINLMVTSAAMAQRRRQGRSMRHVLDAQ